MVSSQNIDFGNIGKGKPFKVSGSVAANSVFYSSDQNNARDPFTYFLQGNLNFSLYEFSIPVNYSYSNLGSDLGYQLPFSFNRLSLHPKYKWIQAHIGDINMSFSPYTLSGHQFTGGGIDLTPKGPLKFSAMYGRLLKATEDDGNAQTQPAFKRMGYGAKIGFQQKKYNLSLIAFYAKDELNSILLVPEERNVLPKENLVLSAEVSLKIIKDLQFKAEYASTAITQDLRAEESANGSGLASLLFNNTASTEYYKAIKTELEYSFEAASFGLGYERIDPGYQTLGAYYFNNDFENITLKLNTSLLKNKINLAFNIGYQRDDLENQKESATSRTVGSVNATYAASKKINITAAYSNFTTFTNTKLNQFDLINDDNLLDNQADQFDYRQLSQNANLGINYAMSNSETKSQNINFNYALATAANEQGGIVRIGDGSTFHNSNIAYTIGFPKKKMNITTAINGTYNTIGREESTTWGPTLNISKKFLDNKLNTTLGSSYNSSTNKTSINATTNIRANASYIYKEKHNFNLNAIQLFKSNPDSNSQELTITFGYNYAFDLSVKRKFPKREKIKEPKVFNFSYKTHVFEGEPSSISPEVLAVSNLQIFKELLKIEGIHQRLNELEIILLEKEDVSNQKYKDAAISYLKYLYSHQQFLETYYITSFRSLKKLYADAIRLNTRTEKEYTSAQARYNTTKNKRDKENLALKEKAFKAHNWMISQLKDLHYDDLKAETGVLANFKDEHISTIFKMLEEKKPELEIYNYLEIEFAELYHSQSFF